jgi:hypothetical protein
MATKPAHTFTVSRTISDQQLCRIIQIESAGRPRAKALTSSATGLFQFLDDTWMVMINRYQPGWKRGLTAKQVLDLRLEPEKSIELGARFTEENAKGIGPGWQEGDLYLSHFLGLGTARKVFRANPGASVEPIAGAAAVRANRSILQGKTCGEVRRWAETVMATRWAKAGKPDWIKKYWKGAALSPPARTRLEPEAEPEVEAEAEVVEEATPVKIDEEADHSNAELTPTSVEVEVVQRRLAAMGYSPGMIDGKWGGGTAGAVAAFKNDYDVIGRPVIDEALIAALDEAESKNFKRPIAAVRANATAEDIAPRVESVRETWRSRLAAKIGVFTGGIFAFFGWIVDQFQNLQDNVVVQKIIGMVGVVPWYLWTAGLVGVLGFIWQSQRKAEQSVVTSYNEGRLTAGEEPIEPGRK